MAEISNKTVVKVRFRKGKCELRDQAHTYFDMLWQNKYVERNELYVYLAEWMGIEEPKAHMRFMDEKQCKEVIEYSIMMLNDNRRLDLDFGAKIKHPYYELIPDKHVSTQTVTINPTTISST